MVHMVTVPINNVRTRAGPRRRPGRSRDTSGGGLIHHSDRGSNYTSSRFGQTFADLGVAASMGSVGDSYDNALMENFFSTLKTELVHRTSWQTREAAENALFAYIDGWYNTRRSQRRRGYLSPDEYEAAYDAQSAEIEETDTTLTPTGAR
jgi:putative transposase